MWLVLNDRTLEWEEVEASCPFCGDHGPGKHHLFLNTTRNIFRCVLCGEKGNSVSLYCQDGGGSNRQAFRALSEDSVLYRFPQQPLSQKPAEREPSSLAVRHNVYYDMLMHLELSPKHKADLLARGLSEERIEQNMYRTLPMSSSARRFLAGILSDFHNLEASRASMLTGDTGTSSAIRGFWCRAATGTAISRVSRSGWMMRPSRIENTGGSPAAARLMGPAATPISMSPGISMPGPPISQREA